MTRSLQIAAVVICFLAFTSGNWQSEKHKGYTLMFTASDKGNIQVYSTLFDDGLASTQAFFKANYKSDFSIYVHPNRHSLDSTWQKDWSMPDFKSECWMVASGVASKLDIISPKSWSQDACEHVYTETTRTQQLITHELVHVFHGQQNASPDFSDVEGIDWFVEGLATYASGQCDPAKMAEVKMAVLENKTPGRLDDFWTGKLRYGQSGSMVMFIDKKYGRTKLIELLKFNRKTDILAALKTTEAELMDGWMKFLKS